MSTFPLQGVIGVIANGADELELAVANKLQCVEIRADLLLATGLSLTDVMAIVKQAKTHNLACLFTLRHPSHGGKFSGSETERVAINRQALIAGADIIDLEWDTDAAQMVLADDIPLILSYHNFTNMPDQAELATLTEQMINMQPAAIKVVPTAATLTDAIRMLDWVATTSDDILRIGFAMGELGACSRILTTAFGAPITYASFGQAVAPGQIALSELLDIYHVMSLNRQTRVIAIVGDKDFTAERVLTLNHRFKAEKINKIALPFQAGALDDLKMQQAILRIDAIYTE